MNFEYSDRAKEVRDAVARFMEEHVYPNEEAMLAQIEEGERFTPIPLLESLKQKAKAAGLWNLFLPESEHGAGLSNLDYAPACEEMGRSAFAPEVFNCSAPDTGNMEVLVRYGADEQKEEWLMPLLAGEIRSAFAMTEPDAASSDATNVAIRIEREGDNYVINGRKWWTSGALDPRCRILIVMGKTDPDNESRYRQQSMILVPMPWPGLTVKRMLPVFGFDDAPHGHAELFFEDVRVPVSNILLGEGRGFEIAQGRLGPGRISPLHARNRLSGACARAGVPALAHAQHLRRPARGSRRDPRTHRRDAHSNRASEAAHPEGGLHDGYRRQQGGAQGDRDDQGRRRRSWRVRCSTWRSRVFGAAGVTSDYGLGAAYAHARTLRLADGPDEVHRNQIARLELKQYDNTVSKRGGNAFVTQWDELSGEFEEPTAFRGVDAEGMHSRWCVWTDASRRSGIYRAIVGLRTVVSEDSDQHFEVGTLALH